MISLPDGWGLTQIAIHEHQVDTTGGIPFAGTILVQLRLDAPEGTTLEQLSAADLDLFRTGFDHFRLVEQGSTSVGPMKLPRLEYTLTDPEHAQEIQQMVLYFAKGSEIYSLTASQRPKSFGRIKEKALEVVTELVGGES